MITIQSLIDLYYDDVYHYCLYYTNQKELAEDITQETFLKAFERLHHIQDEKKAKTWLLAIARNTAVDAFRREKIRTKIYAFIPQSEPKIEQDSLVRKEEWEELQEELLRLKPHLRQVVILRGLKELSIKETAEVLRCKEQKVRVDYHRAIQQLKKYIRKGGERYEEA